MYAISRKIYLSFIDCKENRYFVLPLDEAVQELCRGLEIVHVYAIRKKSFTKCKEKKYFVLSLGEAAQGLCRRGEIVNVYGYHY